MNWIVRKLAHVNNKYIDHEDEAIYYSPHRYFKHQISWKDPSIHSYKSLVYLHSIFFSAANHACERGCEGWWMPPRPLRAPPARAERRLLPVAVPAVSELSHTMSRRRTYEDPRTSATRQRHSRHAADLRRCGGLLWGLRWEGWGYFKMQLHVCTLNK